MSRGKCEVDFQPLILLFYWGAYFDISLAIKLGSVAQTGAFPNSVAILKSGLVVGGGILVTPIHVFTSCQNVGHFVPENVTQYFRNRTKDFRPHSLDNVTLAAGSRWIYSLEGGQSRAAIDSYPHPSCIDTAYGIWLHDTGVVEASFMFYFKKNIHSLYFWTNNRKVWGEVLYEIIETRANCTVMGWGRTNESNSFSEMLLFTYVTLIPPTECVVLLCDLIGASERCRLTDQYFADYGKICTQNFHNGGPSDGDAGNALYCGGYFYGLISKTYPNKLIGSKRDITIFDRIDYSFDLYTTVVREAHWIEGIQFPTFKTIISSEGRNENSWVSQLILSLSILSCIFL